MNKELQQIFETMGYELSDLHSLEDYEWDLVLCEKIIGEKLC